MTREDQEQLFQPFHSGFAGGTGLGLSITFQILQDHQGKHFDRQRKGARHQGDGFPSPGRPCRVGYQGALEHMKSVLLVDDEPNIIEVLEMALQDDGMEVHKALSGRAALATLRDRAVDIVISDIRMPDISGVELLKQARQIAPETVFIMITAFATTDTAIEALQHGAFDYLTKPFRMEEIRKIIRHALENKRAKADDAPAETDTQARQSQKLFQALHRTRIVGRSPRMLEVYRTIGTVAAGESTVLITGESGTGQGTGRPGHPRSFGAQRRAIRIHQLRSISGDASRERAVRLLQGGFHGRHDQPERAVRSGRRRIDLSRRNRRNDARDAGEASPGAPGAKTAPAGRHTTRCRSTCG